MQKTLFIGYGNVDRQDDGAAFYVLQKISKAIGMDTPEDIDDVFPEEAVNGVRLIYALQLVPEMAEICAEFEKVCFIDAHTGSVPKEINIVPVQACYQPSPMTHHFTPDSCICLADQLYHCKPDAILISVRGYEFGFARGLSSRTGELVDEAGEYLIQWLNL